MSSNNLDEVMLMAEFNGVVFPISLSDCKSIDDLWNFIRGKWSFLIEHELVLYYSILINGQSKYGRCCLGDDSDFKNMIRLIRVSSPFVVDILVTSPTLSSISRNNSSCEKHTSTTFTPIKIPPPTQIPCPEGSLLDEIVPSVCRNVKQFDGLDDDHVPYYDVCPRMKPESLLSDSWSSILTGVGQIFWGGVTEFRTELIKYASKNSFKYVFVKNNQKKLAARCAQKDVSDCPWKISGCVCSPENYFVVKKAVLDHTCSDTLVNDDTSRLSPKVISELVEGHVRSDPTFSSNQVKFVIQDSYGFHINYIKAWRALQIARDKIFGAYSESFDQLRWYQAVCKKTNPGSIVDLQSDPHTHKFTRFFIAFKACIDGFRHCRPMLFIDATSLKGHFKGQLLTATAKDGNNGLFPVAMAVVDAETTANWTYFLQTIKENIEHEKEIFYISDRNAGLMQAFEDVFDDPLHFYCLYHLYTNLKGLYRGSWSNEFRSKMVGLLKQCAYAPTVSLFQHYMEKFVDAGGPLAKSFLDSIPFKKWAVAYSPHIVRYGEMTSNAAESYNSWIKEIRFLPITYMVDVIRRNIMSMFVDRIAESDSWTGILCKRKEKFWNQAKHHGSRWEIKQAKSPNEFEVITEPNFTVNLQQRTCTCFQWQLLGFPCVHAVSVIRRNLKHVSSIVEPCFFRDSFRAAYSGEIHPIPASLRHEHQRLFPFEDRILPPDVRKPVGRPKRKRIPSFGEFSMKQVKLSQCQKCGKMGRHDETTCSIVD